MKILVDFPITQLIFAHFNFKHQYEEIVTFSEEAGRWEEEEEEATAAAAERGGVRGDPRRRQLWRRIRGIGAWEVIDELQSFPSHHAERFFGLFLGSSPALLGQ